MSWTARSRFELCKATPTAGTEFTDKFTHWYTDCFADWFVDWFANLFNDHFIDWFIDWFTDRFTDLFTDCLADWFNVSVLVQHGVAVLCPRPLRTDLWLPAGGSAEKPVAQREERLPAVQGPESRHCL